MEENNIGGNLTVLESLDAYYPTFDGPTVLITNYAKCFNKRGDTRAELMVPKYPKYVDKADFPIHRILSVPAMEGYRCTLPFLQSKSKKVIMRKENPFDIVHVHSPLPLARHVIRMAKKKGIPSVITMHTRFDEDFALRIKSKLINKFLMWYTVNTYRLADYVVCVSDGTVDTLRKNGYDKDNVRVIRNGTDLIYPENAEELKRKVIEKEGLDGVEHVFLSVGRIVENKKLDVAVQTMKILKERGVKFRYLIVGAGSYDDKLRAHVTEAGLDDCVKFTGKIMDRSELSGYYLASDLFIFPSTFDTASLAPIEAAALKLPTLMTKGCSTAEIITDGRNGFLTESEPEKWADKIEEIILNKHLLDEIRENAHKEVYRTWDDVTDEVRRFYVGCIEEYSAKRSEKKAKKTEK
ncbi:MAG: glycosyltransferase [Clostridia bacterium]|nr:glycosyltransferase [Clostridia bacterium]